VTAKDHNDRKFLLEGGMDDLKPDFFAADQVENLLINGLIECVHDIQFSENCDYC
jgi:hypothetical protein